MKDNTAYYSEGRFGILNGRMPENLSQYQAQVSKRKTGEMAIWAHDPKEAMDIAQNLTPEEVESLTKWVHVEQAIEVGDVPVKQAENPMIRFVTVIVKEQDGMDIKSYPIHIRTSLPNDKIIPAIKAAAQDYLNTPEGRKTWEENCSNFNYGDFDLNVSNEFCIPHGFSVIATNMADVIEDDFNVTLAEPEGEC